MSKEHKIQMVVFDWAGTTVDYASSAPHKVFDLVFTNHKIKLSAEEIDRPMGMEKRAHIKSLLSCESGTNQFKQVNGRMWDDNDVENYYEEFEGTLYDVVADFSTPIDGVAETVDKLRAAGLKIGSTTGYTSQIMERVIPKAESLGYKADAVVTPDIAGGSRPAPYMIFHCMQELGVYPPCEVVKVGDTVVDIEEGKNAGAWSVGILQGSNLLGLSKEEYDAMDAAELAKRKEKAEAVYREAGADYVIDSIRELPDIIAQINARMAE